MLMARATSEQHNHIRVLVNDRRVYGEQRVKWENAAADALLSRARANEIIRACLKRPRRNPAVTAPQLPVNYADARDNKLRRVAYLRRRAEAEEIRITIERSEQIDAVNAENAHLFLSESALRSVIMSEVANVPNNPTGVTYKRHWKNVEHEVIVLDKGFTYNGQYYKSLSSIAKLITGTSWSGPVFFGLKSTPRVAKKAAERAASETPAIGEAMASTAAEVAAADASLNQSAPAEAVESVGDETELPGTEINLN